MNHFKCTNGNRVSKAEIDRNVRKAKELKLQSQLNEMGFNYCEQCMVEGYSAKADPMELKILDCSHDWSVNRCQTSGRSELAWDVNNIYVLCRYHHKIKDKLNLRFSGNE